MRHVHLNTVLLNGEDLARHLLCEGQKLLLTAVSRFFDVVFSVNKYQTAECRRVLTRQLID